MAHELLTRTEAAEQLRVSSVTLWRVVVSGELPTVRIGSRVLFRQRDLHAFIDGRLSRRECR